MLCALNRVSGGGQNKQILSELTIKVCLHFFGLPLASPQCCGLPSRTEGVRGGGELWQCRLGAGKVWAALSQCCCGSGQKAPAAPASACSSAAALCTSSTVTEDHVAGERVLKPVASLGGSTRTSTPSFPIVHAAPAAGACAAAPAAVASAAAGASAVPPAGTVRWREGCG